MIFAQAAVELFEMALVECECVATTAAVQQPDLKPLILHSLPPPVIAGARESGECACHGLSSVSRTPLEPWRDRAETGLVQLPTAHTVTLGAEECGGGFERVIEDGLLVGHGFPTKERGADLRHGLRAGVHRHSAPRCCAKCADDRLPVGDRREQPAHRPQPLVHRAVAMGPALVAPGEVRARIFLMCRRAVCTASSLSGSPTVRNPAIACASCRSAILRTSSWIGCPGCSRYPMITLTFSMPARTCRREAARRRRRP